MDNNQYLILDNEGVNFLTNSIASTIKDVIEKIRNESNLSDNLIFERILNPDQYPLSTKENIITFQPNIELGGIDRKTGENEERDDSIRTSDFVSVVGGKTYRFTNGKEYQICICCYNSNKEFLTNWFDGFSYRYLGNNVPVQLPSDAAYIKFYCSKTNDLLTKFIMINTEINNEIASFVSQYFSNSGYKFYSNEFDPGLWSLKLSRNTDEFSILSVAAPKDKPHEATLSLDCNGDTTKQFVDVSCMRYDENARGQVCIVCQKRGSSTPLPYFFIGFNDGEGDGRIQKLIVNPDAIPIKFTSTGINVRRNNKYDNDWLEEETVNLNLADIHDNVENLVNSQLSETTPYLCTAGESSNIFTCQYPEGLNKDNTIIIGNRSVLSYNNSETTVNGSVNFDKVIYEENQIYCEITNVDSINVKSLYLYLKKVNPITI